MKVTAWSPSRWAKWKECPAKVKYEDLLKMCPVCFKGRVSGGFDGKPVVCDTCDDEQPSREALDRGNRLDAALTAHVGKAAIDTGTAAPPEAVRAHQEHLAESTRHPKILALVKKLRVAKNVQAQVEIAIDAAWRRVEWFSRQAWGRVKLDVLRLSPKRAEVIDWKSGNIDKGKGVIRERPEYHDSMLVYQIGVLSTHPQAECEATMAFLDAPPKLDEPFKSLPVLKRKDLAAAQKQWEQKISPMMNDELFSPRPGFYCGWCDFSKRKGGTCPY